jgi:hypothetical protein
VLHVQSKIGNDDKVASVSYLSSVGHNSFVFPQKQEVDNTVVPGR